ncbi:MAG: EamA family transporter [Candidatus Dojkabacteria bacterium]|nr:EamA family transporter [Candidatus Dojkabacteria bacterium]
MSIGVVYALVAAIGYSLRSYIFKLAVNKGYDPALVQLVYRIISIPISIIFLLLLKNSSLYTSFEPSYVLLLVCSITVSFLADRSVDYGFAKLDISVASLFAQLSPLFAIIVSFVLLHEVPGNISIVGILIIVVTSLWFSSVLNSKATEKTDRRGAFGIIAGQFLYNVNGVMLRTFAIIMGELSYIFYFSIGLAVLYSITAVRRGSLKILKTNRKSLSILIVYGVISYFPFLFTMLAFKNILIPVAFALTSLSLIFTILMGYLFLGERKDLYKKLAAGMTMLAGGILSTF